MLRNPIPIILLLLSLHLKAEDWKLADGTTYKNVQVLRSDSTTVTILDNDGGATVDISTLPSELQKRFHFNPSNDPSSETRWSSRLSELDTTLVEFKQKGGGFAVGAKTVEWANVSKVTPGGFAYATETGAGTIPFSAVPKDIARSFKLSPEEAAEWNSDEAAKRQGVLQKMSQVQKSEEDEAEAASRMKIAQQEAILVQQQTLRDKFVADQKQGDDKEAAEAAQRDEQNQQDYKLMQKMQDLINEANASSGEQKAGYLAAIDLLQPDYDAMMGRREQAAHDANIKAQEDIIAKRQVQLQAQLNQ